MLTAGDLVFTIRADKSQLNKTLSDSEKGVQQFGNKLSAWTIAKGQMIAQFATKAVTKVGEMGKALVENTIKAYGTFEQLQGGAELLFGTAFEDVMSRAQEAYKTVQMSANDYLDAVNGYAVGLKTSLGGDEKAAATLADRIITAQADIVAATGKSRDAVQNAFSGVMRGNFMMLDNLGLGIKGSKEGMEDVIKAVNEWNKAQGKATEYQMGNLADMENALVDYVEMQGLAGYAGKEAADTIEGTMASTKAAWENLLVAFGSGKDIKKATRNLADSAKKLFKNILPVAKNAITGIGDFFSQIIPEVKTWLGTFSAELLKSDNPLSNAVGQIGDIFVNGFSWEKLGSLVETAWNGVIEGVKGLAKIVFGENVDGTIKWPTWDDVGTFITEAWNGIKTGISGLAKLVFGENVDGTIAWPTWKDIETAVGDAWRGIIDGVKGLGTTIGKVVFGENVDGTIAYPTWEEIGTSIKEAWNWIVENVDQLPTLIFGDDTVVGKALQDAFDWCKQAIADIKSFLGLDRNDRVSAKTLTKNEAGTLQDYYRDLRNKTLYGEYLGDAGTDFLSDRFYKKLQSSMEGAGFSADEIAQAVEKIQNSEDPAWVSTFIESLTQADTTAKALGESVEAVAGDYDVNYHFHTFGDTFVKDRTPNGRGFRPKATGMLTVPYDNFPALLHRDEQVLTASQARHRNSGGDVNYEYIGQMIGGSIERAMERVNVLLDGGKVGDMTSRRTNKNIRRRESAVLHGMGG